MTQKIVCLDGYTLNPGDLSWEAFDQLGNLTVYDRTPVKLIDERAQGATVVLTNKTPLSDVALQTLPDLKYIGVLATGHNIVDVESASNRGIVVSNVPLYGTDTVAQHTFALILEMIRKVHIHHEAVQRGDWCRCDDWCFSLAPIMELTGKTLGIVGMGRIGRATARIGAAMGMCLVGHDLYWPSSEQLGDLKVLSLPMDDVFTRADVVSMHCPLTDQTQRLVNADRLKMMKPTSLLVNTSRGPLVDNQALADALRQGTIAGAGLDVLDEEPPSTDNPLLRAPNCIITPHIAWYAKEARQRMMDTAVQSLKAFLDGEPINQVN